MPQPSDGGFEAPSVGAGRWDAFAYEPAGGAWQFAGYAGLAGNGSGFTVTNPAAPEGSQAAFVQMTGSASQAVGGLTAGRYAVALRAAQRSNHQDRYQVLEVRVDGAAVGTVRPVGATYDAYTTAGFDLAAGTHTVALVGLNPAGGDNTVLVDDVRLVAAPAPAGAVADGGFEAPNVGTGRFEAFRYNPAGSAWSFAGFAGLTGNASGFTAGNPDAPEGGQAAFVQMTGSASQAVGGLTAGRYAVALRAAQRATHQASYQVLDVRVDGASVGTVRPAGTGYQAFTTGTVDLPAGAHTVSLVGLNPNGGDNTVFVDDVRLEPVAVPPPPPPPHDEPHPHPTDPAKQAEHLAVFSLVRDAEATHRSARSGPWADPATWGGSVPTADARVVVGGGHTVTVDADAASLTVRVDGVLRRSAGTFRVETEVVGEHGRLEVTGGTTVYRDTGPIDPARDPLQIGRGLVSHGAVRIAGAEATAWVNAAAFPRRGETTLTLAAAPRGWQVGGRVLVPDVYGEGNHEVRRVVGVDGATVTLDAPLAHHHVLDAESGVKLPIAYLDRSVRFTSENTADASRRGHVMFMHSPHADVAYAAFDGLGRTRGDVGVTDPRVGADGQVVPGTAANPRARYALHFHRTGAARAGSVKGVVITDALKLGLVNHDSHVVVEDAVAFGGRGSGFFTETGNELGSFRRCLSVGVRAGFEFQNEALHQAVTGPGRVMRDFGSAGHGFWFQGTAVAAEDNVDVGSTNGFSFFAVPLTDNPSAFRVAAADLPYGLTIGQYDPRRIPAGHIEVDTYDGTSVPFWAIPVLGFKRNVAIASRTGLTTAGFRSLDAFGAGVINRFEDFTAVNVENGAGAFYTQGFRLVRPRLFGGAWRGRPPLGEDEWKRTGKVTRGRMGVLVNPDGTGNYVDGGEVRHFDLGIKSMSFGSVTLAQTVVDAVTGVQLNTGPNLNRTIRVDGLTLLHSQGGNVDLLTDANTTGAAESDVLLWDGVRVRWQPGVSTWAAGTVPGKDPPTR